MGKVMYGDVGIDRRMDMTVTGPAVNETARMESLRKPLNAPAIAPQEFQNACGDNHYLELGHQTWWLCYCYHF